MNFSQDSFLFILPILLLVIVGSVTALILMILSKANKRR